MWTSIGEYILCAVIVLVELSVILRVFMEKGDVVKHHKGIEHVFIKIFFVNLSKNIVRFR